MLDCRERLKSWSLWPFYLSVGLRDTHRGVIFKVRGFALGDAFLKADFSTKTGTNFVRNFSTKFAILMRF